MDNMPNFDIFNTLVAKEDRYFLYKYVKYHQFLLKHFLKEQKNKKRRFSHLRRAITHTWSNKNILGFLQEEFIKRNMSLSLLSEPIEAYDWLSKNDSKLTLDKLSPIIMQVVSPFARFIAVLNLEHPPFYHPFSELVYTYLILYFFEDKSSQTILKNMGLNFNKKVLLNQAFLLFEEGKNTLSVTKGLKFKCRLAFFIGLAKVLLIRQQKNNQEKINFLDSVNAFLYGLWYFVKIKNSLKKVNQI